MPNTYQTASQWTAFISCSLHIKDRIFVDLVESIVRHNHLQPFGTVGLYSAAPTSPAELMRKNIPIADIIVIVATPRYLQTDVKTGQKTSGISEMLHVESGIAFAYNKPILVFVQKGTSVGNFLPTVTQYITLDGSNDDLRSQWNLINCLFTNAIRIAQQTKATVNTQRFKKAVGGGLAVLGAFKLMELFAEGDAPIRKPSKRKTTNNNSIIQKKPMLRKKTGGK